MHMPAVDRALAGPVRDHAAASGLGIPTALRSEGVVANAPSATAPPRKTSPASQLRK